MKRLLMLAVASAAIFGAVMIAKKRRRAPMHAAELAGPDVIIDEVVIHFDLSEDPLQHRWT